MHRYERTNLWQATLAVQLESDAEAAARRRLRSAYEVFRDRAAMLANEIARELPDFTVHDITHIDALWEMADLAAGGHTILTPAEAFVLGGAILIHDLGLGLAALPGGRDSIKSHPLWADTRAALSRSRGSRDSVDGTTHETEDIERQATAAVLRQLHAENAEKLALQALPLDYSVRQKRIFCELHACCVAAIRMVAAR